MKRRLISPLVSGLVLPGTGQVLNRQPIKGIALIAGTTVLFLLILMKVLVDLNRVFQTTPDLSPDPQIIQKLASAMSEQDHTYLMVLVILLLCVWIFSIVDAYIHGKRLDDMNNETTSV
ncbi:MAG: hypothetical protein HY788_12875 [Deltaproteobacteria bacterium]|nr:hypothetical protein [Deltaproteobacteria bacterium]